MIEICASERIVNNDGFCFQRTVQPGRRFLHFLIGVRLLTVSLYATLSAAVHLPAVVAFPHRNPWPQAASLLLG
jgi:hypothetical protein